jgi:hypothetical protein
MGATVIFAILVPISALPPFLLVCFLWGLGDYLFTMLTWFVGALAILIIVHLFNILPPVPLIVVGAIGLFCAPFIGLEVRDKREQQRKLKEQEWWLLWQLERELSGRALGGVLAAVDGIADEDDDDAGVGRSRPRRRA